MSTKAARKMGDYATWRKGTLKLRSSSYLVIGFKFLLLGKKYSSKGVTFQVLTLLLAIYKKFVIGYALLRDSEC